MPSRNDLTDKERRFAEEYVANGYKAVQAYLVVYQTDNISTAKANSYQVLKRDRVKQYVKELQKDGFEAACINAERIATELAQIAFAEKADETYTTNFKLKAIELLQKQLGLQTTKIDADINQKTTISVTVDDEE